MLGNGFAFWKHTKIVVLGETKAGKTSLIRSLLNQQFRDKLDSTGISIHHLRVDGELFKDNSNTKYAQAYAHQVAFGQRKREFRFLKETIDPTDLELSDCTQYAINRVQSAKSFKHKNAIKSIPSLHNEQTHIDRYIDYKYSEQFMLNAKSMDNGFGATIWDLSGQLDYQFVNHIFTSESGICILVFDAYKMFIDASQSQFKLIDLLNSMKPRGEGLSIFLVGTYLDVYDEHDPITKQSFIKSVDKILRSILRDFFPDIDRHPEVCFFPVSNKTREGIPELILSMQSLLRVDDDYGRVHSSWISVLDELFDSCKKKRDQFILLNDYKEMAGMFGITSHEEIQDMLTLFHETGLLLYFKSTEVLQNMIIIDPQWLFAMVSMISCRLDVHMWNESDVLKAGLVKDLHKLFERGLASREILDYICGGEHVDYIIELMKTHLLMSEWRFKTKTTVYLIPSMIRDERPLEENILFSCVGKMEFSFMPIGLFERLMCLSVNYYAEASRKEPQISRIQAIFWLTDGTSILMSKGSEKSLIIYVEDEFAAGECLSMLEVMLKKIKVESVWMNFTWETQVRKVGEEFRPLRVARREVGSPWAVNSRNQDTNVSLSGFLDG